VCARVCARALTYTYTINIYYGTMFFQYQLFLNQYIKPRNY